MLAPTPTERLSRAVVSATATLLVAVSSLAVAAAPSARAQDNVLLITLDDIGVDGIAAYGEGSSPAPTPTITGLANRGVLFRNAYVPPICKPMRATLQTGRYGFRTGIGSLASSELPLAETALPEILPPSYASGVVGKWHLGGSRTHPNDVGWQHYAGVTGGGVNDYFSWRKTVNGRQSTSTNYLTTETVDDAVDWINGRTTPWVLNLNFNAPHNPLHVPPTELHDYDLQGRSTRRDGPLFYKAMVQALDTELGRLLAEIGAGTVARTNIILIGDNGSPRSILESPFPNTGGKGSLFESGINVPLIVAGPVITAPGREVDAFVHSVDLFHTVAELTGVDARQAVPAGVPLDGISIVPYLTSPAQASLRPYSYNEVFGSDVSDSRSVRGPRYKVIQEEGAPDRFFDLQNDPFETSNLLARTLTLDEQYQYDRLLAELARTSGRASWFAHGSGCAGQLGPPLLQPVAGSRPLHGAVFRTELVNLHGSVSQCLGVLGFERQVLDLGALGLPGCTAYARFDLLQSLAAVQGRAVWNLPIPDAPDLLGLSFHQQGIVLELTGSAHRLVLTNAGSGVIERN